MLKVKSIGGYLSAHPHVVHTACADGAAIGRSFVYETLLYTVEMEPANMPALYPLPPSMTL